MNVVQVAIGRFHHFHLARQLERFGLLDRIWTGYPPFKLKDETGIPREKIRTFPWVQTLSMGWPRVPLLGRSAALRRELAWLAQDSLDRRVARALQAPRVVVALSGQGEHCGRRAQSLGGRHVCDRGSSHIRVQDRLMREEHERWNLPYRPIDPRIVAKEEREYAAADLVTVPSGFVERTFLASGVPAEKLRRIPYGGRLDRFKPQGAPPDPDGFDVLFVGHVSLRKGVPYLLEAFGRLRHPAKRLRLVGDVDPALRPLLARLPLDRVEFLGPVPNGELARHYGAAHVMVLPSIEEGLAMVMAEAMACGCPVIASRHTGAEDLFDDGEGLMVPIRSSDAILEQLSCLADDTDALAALRQRALDRIKAIGGWNSYGEAWKALLGTL